MMFTSASDPWSAMGSTNTGYPNPLPLSDPNTTFAVGSLSPYGRGIPLATTSMTQPSGNPSATGYLGGYYPEYANTPSSWQNTQNYTDASKTANVTDASSQIFAPETNVDLKNYYNYLNLTLNKYYPQPPTPPTPPTPPQPPTPPEPPKCPEIKLPDPPKHKPETKLKNKGTNWGLIAGIGAAALGAIFFLPKLFKGKKAEKTVETVKETAPEVCETKTETTDEINAHGDPVFVTRNSKGQVTKQEEVHSGTVFKDSTSSLSVEMDRRDPKNVFMKAFNYDVNGQSVKGDASGKVSVGGKTVKPGDSEALPNGGSVTVSKETGTSDGGFTNQYQIVIKAPNKTGDGYENITLHARKNKRGLIMYEFNVAKKSETTNEQEKVTSGFLLDAFKKEYNNQGVEKDDKKDKDVVVA
jgi:hypothetical protein